MDHYADDLAALLDTLDLRHTALVGHSTGGGEVARHIGRHGADCLSKAVLVGAVPPLMLKTASNPGGLPIALFDQFLASITEDHPQFYKDMSLLFYGANRLFEPAQPKRGRRTEECACGSKPSYGSPTQAPPDATFLNALGRGRLLSTSIGAGVKKGSGSGFSRFSFLWMRLLRLASLFPLPDGLSGAVVHSPGLGSGWLAQKSRVSGSPRVVSVLFAIAFIRTAAC
ncbi:hypothetical protein KSX_55520 [Ktedonospora formicarum]|uniref:AB hydrolase-1 domain-containing protein n=1 Tax=Ktedonospora formicarum TaxID=2778364 RepID=A0A8J3I8K0_9CHLR|nr:hypothetical protein KSX_55520 [Ktedonospora formicarum]